MLYLIRYLLLLVPSLSYPAIQLSVYALLLMLVDFIRGLRLSAAFNLLVVFNL